MMSRTHGQPATPTTLGKEIANFVYRLREQRTRFAAVAIAARSTARSATSMRIWSPIRRSTGRARPALRRIARADLESVHDADRAARLDGGILRCAGAPQHRADRPVPRHVGLHLDRLLPPARRRRRSRLLDHAAQGESDRFRERRGQSRAVERAAALPGGQAAGVALAARSHGLDRAAQCRRRGQPCVDRLALDRARPGARRSGCRRGWRRTSTPIGSCWRNRSRPSCVDSAWRTRTSS